MSLQPTNVTAQEAEDYQPFVEQAGSQPNFPNATGTNPFALTGTVVRYLAIGGMALTSLSRNPSCNAHAWTRLCAEVGCPQCHPLGLGISHCAFMLS